MPFQLRSFLHSTRLISTIWYSLLFLILELSIGAFIYFYLYSSLSDQLNFSLTKQATAIIKYFSDSKPEFDTFEPDSLYSAPEELVWDIIYDAVALNPRNTFIQISYNNKLIYKSDNLKKTELTANVPRSKDVYISELENPLLSKQKIRAASVWFDKYKIVVAFPVEYIGETLNSLINIYKYIFPFFLIISFVGGAIISSKALSRIDKIIAKTDAITAKNLDMKIEGEDIDDEYGRLVKKMNSMISRIQASFDYLNRFSIAASHELKTPLTILRGEIEVALKSPKTAEHYKEILESNYEETLRLIRIVDNVFYISRLDRSMIQFHMQVTNIYSFLEKTVRSMEILGREKNISFLLSGDTLATAAVDANQMKQVFYNVLDNAIKYGNENSTVTVQVSISSDNHEVIIVVTNEGEGIAPDSIQKIFEPFYRADSVRGLSIQGAGLGLSVVKSIIDSHNGKISVHSSPGKETTFVISLPAQ